MMKKIATVLAMLVALMMVSAAWAGEYFSSVEKQQIRQTVRAEFPRAEVDFVDTEIKGAGVLIDPLPDGQNLFIHADSEAEIFTYRFPDEYKAAAMRIVETVYRIVDRRPASHPGALGRDLLERQGIK